MKKQTPIRIGIIGLSSKPRAWATLAHVPRLSKSLNFEIVALCNSTLESTQKAIEAHKLPPSTKAYASYEAIAADADVDLIVVSTRADTHYKAALPALKAGKNVFIEWPLAATTEDAEQMAALARENGLRTMVGFQGRMSPSIRKVKQLIDAGALGEIHSVNFQGAVGVWQNNAAEERYAHFMDRKTGGNLLTIYGGHILDSIFYAVGELKQGSYHPLAVNSRPWMHVLEADGSISTQTYEKDTPDQILLQGQLDRNPPAALSFHLRAGSKSSGCPGSTWRIYGTRAELVVEFESAGPQMAQARSMRLYDFQKDVVEEVTVDEGGEEWTQLPVQAQNIGRLYEAYAAGESPCDFDLGVSRHELMDKFWATMPAREGKGNVNGVH